MLAEVYLQLFPSGIHLQCEDCDIDEFIPLGNGNKFMEVLNDIYIMTNPNTTYELTEKGKRLLKELEKDEDLV